MQLDIVAIKSVVNQTLVAQTAAKGVIDKVKVETGDIKQKVDVVAAKDVNAVQLYFKLL